MNKPVSHATIENAARLRKRDLWPPLSAAGAGIVFACFWAVTSPSFSLSRTDMRSVVACFAISIPGSILFWHLGSAMISRLTGLPPRDTSFKMAAILMCSLVLMFYIPIYLLEPHHPVLQPYVRYFLVIVTSLCAGALAFVLFLPERFQKLVRLVNHRATWCFVILVVVFTLTVTLLALRKWRVFGYVGVDTAVIWQAIVYTLRGRFFYTPFEGQRFALRISPIEITLVPIYALTRSPNVVPLLIPVMISVSAVPLYALAKRKLGPAKAILVAATYLLLPYIASRTVMDFHDILLAPAFLLTAIYFFERERFRSFLLLLILSMWTHEFVAFTTLLFSLLALARGRSKKWVLGPGTLSIGWLFACFKVIMPHFSGSQTPLAAIRFLGEFGSTPLEILFSKDFYRERIFNLKSVSLVYQLLQPLLFFLPLASVEITLLALPSLALNLALPRTGIRDQEAIILGPILIWAYISTLGKLSRWLERFGKPSLSALRIPSLVPILSFFIALSCLPYWFRIDEYMPKPYWAAQVEAVASIPKDASVSAPEYMWAQLFERPYIEGLWGLRNDESYPQYLILDVHFQDKLSEEAVFSAAVVQDYRRLITETQEGGEYKALRLLWEKDGIYVFRKSRD